MRLNNDKILNQILMTVDVSNTLNGGLAQSQIATARNNDHLVVTVKAPGVTPERLKIEINNHLLTVFHLMDFNSIDQPGEVISMPHILHKVPLPIYAELEKVSASYEDGLLEVIVPFDETINGFKKEVDIRLN